jgi:histidinol-phosphate aminotransferase
LIVARTFSKWAGLAGLRAGYGIFARDLANIVLKIKPPYNVSVAAQAAIKASFEDLDYLLEKVKIIVAERDRLLGELRKIAFLEPYPSEANFVLCKITRGSLANIRAGLEAQGIFLRYYDDPRLRSNLRISVGTPDQNDRLLRSLREIEESV